MYMTWYSYSFIMHKNNSIKTWLSINRSVVLRNRDVVSCIELVPHPLSYMIMVT
jgi:hypothetical protein